MPSEATDTESFIPDLASKGLKAAIVHSPRGLGLCEAHGVAAVALSPFYEQVWKFATLLTHGEDLPKGSIAVTGTNGKTTIAWLLSQALQMSYLGTLGYLAAGSDDLVELSNTTLMPVQLMNLLRDKGLLPAVMEVSSHALDQRRADGVDFSLGLFTNLTQDHLDYHGTTENYANAKKRLFTELVDHAILNVKDPIGAMWYSELGSRATSVSVSGDADLRIDPIEVGLAHSVLRLRVGSETHEGTTSIGGRFNIENLALVLAALIHRGHHPEKALEMAGQLNSAPGRFECMEAPGHPKVILDYAHTPDALEKLLLAVREVTKGRMICVFGCGGDRDRLKRPRMASAVSSRADLTIVTEDNPRTEPSDQIFGDILQGIVQGRAVEVVKNRREAIHHAIRSAERNDVVVIAGKGHERMQIVGRERIPMDEREIVREAWA
jgi:UDP-N-acetylmuramoyl-L-alanyl-D-glutamate--2,6-diaminopimelate ligase